MCGRYVFEASLKELMQWLDIKIHEQVMLARYNIAPMQPILILHRTSRDRPIEADWVNWGLIPHWAKELAIGNKLINARSETAAEKPSFRDAYRYRRCVIPANGFYEWQSGGSAKQPMYITPTSGRFLAFAGLWESWHDRETASEIQSATILTTAASSLLKPIHHRMPVMLKDDAIHAWLNPDLQNAGEINNLLATSQIDTLNTQRVSKAVNNTRNDDPSLIAPLPDDGMPTSLFG